ncbi:hypothetical protein [Arthrobacter sp. VKM Ac-2550]|uniref:hypothetical protein n=1 Tax=Crystallibacter permensis TaxID=1938888 RepID=UPI0022263341|nr:hypothetical protein [Arthrobacter sp. VKM Ac-2550]MCW2131449.1 hypothetical protein [Arthrobacter sp. VKM Ac-2550]
MGTKSLLKASALLAAAVVLGLLAVQGTYALWNKMVPVGAGTIPTADFRVSLTDLSTGVPIDMTDSTGTSALVSLKPTGSPSPGKPAYAGVRISNVTNAGSDFAVRASTGEVSITNVAPGLSGLLSVNMQAVLVEKTNCSAEDFAGTASSGSATANISKNSSAVFCFQILMTGDAPSGGSARVDVPIIVNQL